VALPAEEEVLVTSAPLTSQRALPVDAAVWLATKTSPDDLATKTSPDD
jgi:hypothetical protein